MTIIAFAIFLVLVFALLALCWLRATRHIGDTPIPTVEPTPSPFRRTQGHTYRMRLPDRLRMELHK